ncbi:interferon alpha-inducible protein 27, mitochondrial-like isoform X1 [Meles meles]|uniref:interferon alpha-inducible protein 27, mitochondrial-like isoform X1 n=2 Tax=Meles meles TaxID=9662 RepID=UPI001E69BFF8|nr:interferon alpha-inducible protein 27, mitochondrial-like isoform X1 [Meles meles]
MGSRVMTASIAKATEVASGVALSQATASVESLPGTPKASRMAALSLSSAGVKTVAAVIGGVVSVASVPTVLGAMGFTGAGITASSLAAKMMSSAAIANGGGVAAGSLVATLQSVGAAGLSLSTKFILGSLGSVLTYLSF